MIGNGVEITINESKTERTNREGNDTRHGLLKNVKKKGHD